MTIVLAVIGALMVLGVVTVAGVCAAAGILDWYYRKASQ